MPAPLLTWTKANVATMPSSSVAGALAGLNSAINAHVAANPSTALWQVADFNAGNGTLTLKPTTAGITAGAEADARLMFFGGATPNTAAVDGMTVGTTVLYCGLSRNSTSDAPEASYTAGAPFANWLPGGAVAGAFGAINRVTYWETAAGIVVAWHLATMAGATSNLFTAILGRLAVSLDGETAYWLAHGGNSAWSANQDSAAAPNATWFVASAAEDANTARANVWDGTDNIRVARATIFSAAGWSHSLRDSGNSRYFLPVLLKSRATVAIPWKLRQIAYGPAALFAETLSTVSGVAAHKLGASGDTNADGPWLTNFRV